MAFEALEFRAPRILTLREQQLGLPGGSEEIDSLLGAMVTAHLSLPKPTEAGVMRAKVGQKRPEVEVRDRGKGLETEGGDQRQMEASSL